MLRNGSISFKQESSAYTSPTARLNQTVLGVTFTHTLSFAPHILKLTGKAAASLYALKTHGLHGQALWDVTQATLVAQLLYASPAWSGFIKADEKAKLQSVLNKAVRYGFLTNYKPVEYLFDSSDTSLFSAILRRPDHVLHPLLPPLKLQGIICVSAAMAWNYLRFSLVFWRKNLYIECCTLTFIETVYF